MGSGGIGGGVPRRLLEGNGGGGGGSGGGSGGGVLELRPAVRAGDWGLLSEKPELELEGEDEEGNKRTYNFKLETWPKNAPNELMNRIIQVTTEERREWREFTSKECQNKSNL